MEHRDNTRRTNNEMQIDKCEKWGHLPEPVFSEDGTATELRCGRCKRPMRNDNS